MMVSLLHTVLLNEEVHVELQHACVCACWGVILTSAYVFILCCFQRKVVSVFSLGTVLCVPGSCSILNLLFCEGCFFNCLMSNRRHVSC